MNQAPEATTEGFGFALPSQYFWVQDSAASSVNQASVPPPPHKHGSRPSADSGPYLLVARSRLSNIQHNVTRLQRKRGEALQMVISISQATHCGPLSHCSRTVMMRHAYKHVYWSVL